MRRNFGVVAFAGVVLAAGVAHAQFPPANVPQADVPGVPSGDPTDTVNEAYFTASATIDSVFQFDVTNSTIDCGVVAYGDTSPTTCVDTATFTVESNNNWQATINDGTGFDATPAAQSVCNLLNLDQTNYATSGFQFDIQAISDDNAEDVETTPQSPTASTDVTISGSYTTNGANAVDAIAVDPTDGKGDYTGDFVVTLYEP